MVDRCLSGGCDGADILWGDTAEEHGHKVIHYGFTGIKSDRPIQVLNIVELMEADTHLMRANQALCRSFPCKAEYVNNLLRRNWWQIKNTERVYAVAPISRNLVMGGTGWAVQMAIDKGLNEIYVFDLNRDKWTFWHNAYERFINSNFTPPPPHGTYTGIGSRELTETGRKAIKDVYKNKE